MRIDTLVRSVQRLLVLLRGEEAGSPTDSGGEPTGSPRAPRGVYIAALVLALLVGFSVISRYSPYTFLKRDASFYATTTRGLANDLSLDQRRWQPASWYDGRNPEYQEMDMAWSNVAIGSDGTWYPKHSYVMPFFAMPFYRVFGSVGLLVFNSLCALLVLVAAYLIAVEFAPPAAGLAAVILMASGPAFVEHTYHFSLDVFTAALVALGAAALLHFRVVLAGLLLGTALWTRPTLLPLVLPLAVAFAWGRLSRRQMFKLGAAAALPLTAAALANLIMFGAPWVTSYHRVLTLVDGIPIIRSHTDCFSATVAEGAKRLFWSVDDGWLPRSPSVFLALAGLLCLWHRARSMAIGLALAAGGYVALFLTYKYTTARFFFAWQALLCLPLALLLADLDAMLRWAAGRLRLPHRFRVAAVSAAVVLAAAGLLAHRVTADRGGYVLSQHIEEARVTKDNVPCDYFNMALDRWECSKLEDDNWEYTGLALKDDQCLFGKRKGPAIWFHPPAGKSTKRLYFDNLPADATLRLEYGLADSADSSETCFTVSWGDGEPERLCADEAGKLLTRSLTGPGTGRATLEFAIEAPPRDRRHLCLDGQIVR